MESRKFSTSAGARGGVNERKGLPDSRDKKRKSSRVGSPDNIMSKGKANTLLPRKRKQANKTNLNFFAFLLFIV